MIKEIKLGYCEIDQESSVVNSPYKIDKYNGDLIMRYDDTIHNFNISSYSEPHWQDYGVGIILTKEETYSTYKKNGFTFIDFTQES